MALERGGVAEPSMALPTHLEALTGTLAACADKGRWQQCLPIAAALVGGDADADADAAASTISVSPLPEMAETTSRFPEMTSGLPEITSRFPEMLSRLSARDRAVYALDLPRYEACPTAAKPSAAPQSPTRDLHANMYVHGSRYEAHLGRSACGTSAPLNPLEVTQNPLALGCARQVRK